VRVTPVFLLGAVLGHGLAGLLVGCSARYRSFHLTRERLRGRTRTGARGFVQNRSQRRAVLARQPLFCCARFARAIHLACRWRACPAGHDCSASLPGLAMHASPPFWHNRCSAPSASAAHLPNSSLKRTAAYRRLCYHAVTRQRPLSSSVRPRKQLFSVYHARRSVWYFASPIALAQRFRSCCRSAALACALLSALPHGALARSCAHCSRAGALAAQATAARLGRTAGSVALAVFSSVVSNARGMSELTAGLTIRSSRTAAG